MSEFMFRVRLEFSITPTETTEAHGPRVYRKDSPNLNLHIADFLKSAGILCSDNDPDNEPFSRDLLPDTWVVGNTALITGDINKPGQYIVFIRSPPFPMEVNSFQIIDRICTLLKNNYIIEYPIYDYKFHPVEIVTSEDECKQPLHSPWNCVVSAMKERASNNNPMTALEAIDKILNSTLDIKRIENWVRVCMGIIRFLDSFDDDFTYFEDFIRGVPDGKTYSPEDLLTDIGLPELIEFYKPQFDEHAQWSASQIGSMDEWMYWNR
ncbi:hypothetical protein L207DRAFT_536209 [Hyaloscypha variabilis F]|uniref:Uncharacterized protein n=1 Tax=Hyaloscypha variabilis (strain UAMH 11265 / GT02V1 / F) TaxID=1149755 RepID=A0A2J6R1F1_HYAVF|nr:hypothetical protein L207DRAFT_536209 [Hyaloscypha variabilis F]